MDLGRGFETRPITVLIIQLSGLSGFICLPPSEFLFNTNYHANIGSHLFWLGDIVNMLCFEMFLFQDNKMFTRLEISSSSPRQCSTISLRSDRLLTSMMASRAGSISAS